MKAQWSKLELRLLLTQTYVVADLKYCQSWDSRGLSEQHSSLSEDPTECLVKSESSR